MNSSEKLNNLLVLKFLGEVKRKTYILHTNESMMEFYSRHTRIV